MFVIECFAEDNKIISGIESTFTESDLKKTDFQPIYGCRRPGDNLLFPSALYKFG
jgi:hypothetical protein